MKQDKPLTGRHVAMIFVGGFSVIVAVNLTLAYSAISTFPGLEVKNSYVASQQFDTQRDAQEALGWTVEARAENGLVVLSITDAAGAPVRLAALDATLGRATHVRDDQAPDFTFDGARYTAPADLGSGNWNIRMIAQAQDGTTFRQRIQLRVSRQDS
jgi:nitrogen fixation protein FixH